MTGERPTELDEIEAALKKSLLTRDVQRTADATGVTLTAELGQRSWKLRVKPQPGLGLPSIVVDDAAVGRLAHVSYEGVVCITDYQGLSVDPCRPGDVATFALEDALRVLDAAWHDHQAGDYDALLDEFEGYWGMLPGGVRADLHFALEGPPRWIEGFCFDIDGDMKRVSFADRRHGERLTFSPIVRLRKAVRVPALYLPLDTSVLPPQRGQRLTASEIVGWLSSGMNKSTRARADELLRECRKHVSASLVLFSQSRPVGGRAAFGVSFDRASGRHPLLEPKARWRVRPLQVMHEHPTYLRARGGAWGSLANRHIVVVGCGAVGSRIAELLALAGLGRLTLVDPDWLLPDNIFRHVLGGEWIGLNKAAAMKAAMEARLPGLKATAVEEHLHAWAPTAKFDAVDGVVMATGNPYVERKFIQMMFEGGGPRDLPVLTAWTEPYGLGGHSVLSAVGKRGCLECLYRDASGASQGAPRTAFAEAGQKLSKNLTGCAGGFTPFSATDAAETALVAHRQLLEHLTGGGTTLYRCWRGSDQAFVSAGHRTTHWYRAMTPELTAQANLEIPNARCPVCGRTAP